MMRFAYTGIRVKNMDESVGFYTEILGMKLIGRFKVAATKGAIALLQSLGSGQILELNY